MTADERHHAAILAHAQRRADATGEAFVADQRPDPRAHGAIEHYYVMARHACPADVRDGVRVEPASPRPEKVADHTSAEGDTYRETR